jgi:hypothetical protein
MQQSFAVPQIKLPPVPVVLPATFPIPPIKKIEVPKLTIKIPVPFITPIAVPLLMPPPPAPYQQFRAYMNMQLSATTPMSGIQRAHHINHLWGSMSKEAKKQWTLPDGVVLPTKTKKSVIPDLEQDEEENNTPKTASTGYSNFLETLLDRPDFVEQCPDRGVRFARLSLTWRAMKAEDLEPWFKQKNNDFELSNIYPLDGGVKSPPMIPLGEPSSPIPSLTPCET